MIELLLWAVGLYFAGSMLIGFVVGVLRPFLSMSRAYGAAFDQARREREDS